jgi:hypothetical protein
MAARLVAVRASWAPRARLSIMSRKRKYAEEVAKVGARAERACGREAAFALNRARAAAGVWSRGRGSCAAAAGENRRVR